MILDEPIGPLDVNTQELMRNDLRDLADSERWPLPILISSQHRDEIESIADRVMFLRDREVVCFSTDELQTRANGCA